MKQTVDVEFPEHEKIVLTNSKGDTYTSTSEDLIDFFIRSEDIEQWITFKDIKLENDEYYHCAFQNQFDPNFVYQGIFKCDDGFYDEDGYPLKPTPSHYIHIPKPQMK